MRKGYIRHTSPIESCHDTKIIKSTEEFVPKS